MTEPAAAPTQGTAPVGPYALPPLRFAYDALEPAIGAETMRLHHGKHHQGYVDAVNAALAKHPEWLGLTIEEVLRRLPEVPEDIRQTVRDQGGGHANHQFFWKILTPDGPGRPSGKLAAAIDREFGSFEAFKARFEEAGLKRFGSGWAFLVVHPKEDFRLEILTLPNQDSVLELAPPRRACWPATCGSTPTTCNIATAGLTGSAHGGAWCTGTTSASAWPGCARAGSSCDARRALRLRGPAARRRGRAGHTRPGGPVHGRRERARLRRLRGAVVGERRLGDRPAAAGPRRGRGRHRGPAAPPARAAGAVHADDTLKRGQHRRRHGDGPLRRARARQGETTFYENLAVYDDALVREAGGGAEMAQLSMLANLAAMGCVIVPFPKVTRGFDVAGTHRGTHVRVTGADMPPLAPDALPGEALDAAFHHGAVIARVGAALKAKAAAGPLFDGGARFPSPELRAQRSEHDGMAAAQGYPR